MYESLIDLIPELDHADKPGNARGRSGGTIHRSLEVEFEIRIEGFVRDHPEAGLTHYADILERSGIAWSAESMEAADASHLDGQTVMALLVGAMRAERFSYGIFLEFLRSGAVKRWLERLRQIDLGNEAQPKGSLDV